MTSYEIEIASPSPPFGSGRNHSLRDRWINRDKSNASFKGFKDFVESFSGQKDKKPLSRANSASDDLSQNNIQTEITNNNDDKTNEDLFVHAPMSKNNEKKLDVSQNDVQNRNTKNNQTSHAYLFVHAPTLTKNDEKKLDMSQNHVQNNNTNNNNGKQTSHADLFVHAPTLTKNDEKKLDMSQNDVQKKNINNNNGKQTSHADLFVHAPTVTKNDEKKVLMSQNDVQNKNTNNSGNQTSHADLFVHAPKHKKIDEKNVDVYQNDVHNKNTNNNVNQTGHADLFVHAPTLKKNDEKKMANETELDSSNDCMQQKHHHGVFAPTKPIKTKVNATNMGGVSSLVRRWKDFEESKNSGNNSPISSKTTSAESSNSNISNILLDHVENESLVDGVGESEKMVLKGRESNVVENEKMRVKKFGDQESEKKVLRGRESEVVKNEKMGEKQFGDQESEKTVLRGKESEAVENEKKVKNLLHKLSSVASGGANDENGNGHEANSPSSMGSPRLRGRQEFGDFFMVMEKDRHKELDGLEERKAVSRFSQKGRIQAMLRVQLLRGAVEAARDARKSTSTSFEVNRTPQNSIKRLSERFNPASQKSAPEWKSLKKEVADSPKVEKSTSVQDIKGTHQQEVAAPITFKKEEENTQNKESVAASILVEKKKVEKKKVEEKKVEEKNILPVASSGNVHKEACSRSDFLQEKTNQENKTCSLSQAVETRVKPIEVKEEKNILPVASSGNVHEEVCSRSDLLQERTNQENKSCSVSQSVETRVKPIEVKEEKNILPVATSGNVHKEACSRSDLLVERTNQENKSCSVSQSVETRVKPIEVKEVRPTDVANNRLHSSGISVNMQENQQVKETMDHRRNDSINTQEDWEEVLSNQNLTESENGWVSDVSHTQAGWEELYSDYEQQAEDMQEWIWDVSRPKSEWEGLRKERYQEMLDPYKQKEDIRRLLESKSVSSFLSSGLRDSIDRLMMSRVQQQSSKTTRQADEQEVKVKASKKKIKYRLEKEPVVEKDAIEEAKGIDMGYDEDYENEIQAEKPYEESVEYADQTNNVLTQVAFSPLQHTSSLNSCSQEMQLMYELKGHMIKLQQEVSEIRKSMKSCMNMQHKQRRSAKQDVVAALSQSGQNRGRHSTQKQGLTNKSMCGICNEDEVDSLMYRCGHMCTCFKCAHELLRGSGRCPVCQDPILDVVRVKANS